MMTALIRILSLVSVLTAKSSALSCTQCFSSSSECSGESIPCPAGSLCGSLYTETTIQGIKSAFLIRSCTPASECNFMGSISLNEGQSRLAASCCSTDSCTPNFPSLPTNSPNPNGVVCRTCTSAKSTWCYTSDTIECKGDENMCLLQTTEAGSISTAFRGCSTKSICDLGSQSYSAEGLSLNVKTTCTSGGLSAYRVVLAPAIVCLLLMKLLF